MSRNSPIIHFTEDELADRRRRTLEALTAQGLEGLLCFRQESMYYLSGYDTFGYVFFQCLYLGADGTMTLLTRAPDVGVAAYTSVIEDIRMWVDAPDANPAEDLKAILDEHGCRGRKLGVEYEAYGLTGRSAKRVDAALEGFCELEDASDVVNRLRVVKSPAELEYVHRAAVLADQALVVAKEMARPGVFAAYADTLTRRGITGFANACGYCLGTTFSPNWMDWPMFYRDNPVVVEPGMVFFMHMTTRDHDRGIGAAPGETVVVTENGCKRLSREVLEAGPF